MKRLGDPISNSVIFNFDCEPVLIADVPHAPHIIPRSENRTMIPVLIATVVAFFIAGIIWLLVEWVTKQEA